MADTAEDQGQPANPADTLSPDHPYVVATKALMDHLNTEPKYPALEGLWREARRQYDLLSGTSTSMGRVAGDEHPDYRKDGLAPNTDLSRAHNPGEDDLPAAATKGNGKGNRWGNRK